MSRNAATVDLDAFRADQDAAIDQETADPMTASTYPLGLLDTNILILRRWINPDQLPDEMAISAVTLAELSAGPHQVRPDTEQNTYAERARASTRSRGWRTSSTQSSSASKRHEPTAESPSQPDGSHDAAPPT